MEIPPRAAQVGGIELGGTKIVCAIGTGPYQGIRARWEFPTGPPAETLAQAAGWLRDQEREHGRLEAIGIASFGPVDLAPGSPTYGHITSTPKEGWSNTDLIAPFRREFGGIPIGLDTDVNGAALGEHLWGAAAGLEDFVYVTLGTGIGAGGMARGRLLHGLVHPEMGHLRIPRLAGNDFGGLSVPWRLLGGALLRPGGEGEGRPGRGGAAGGPPGLAAHGRVRGLGARQPRSGPVTGPDPSGRQPAERGAMGARRPSSAAFERASAPL